MENVNTGVQDQAELYKAVNEFELNLGIGPVSIVACDERIDMCTNKEALAKAIRGIRMLRDTSGDSYNAFWKFNEGGRSYAGFVFVGGITDVRKKNMLLKQLKEVTADQISIIVQASDEEQAAMFS